MVVEVSLKANGCSRQAEACAVAVAGWKVAKLTRMLPAAWSGLPNAGHAPYTAGCRGRASLLR